MEYRNLGRTGLKVSTLCMGTMQFGWTATEDDAYPILDHAFANGVNFIDTADIYSNWAEGNPGGVAEEIIGRWLKKSSIPRHQVILATKVRGRLGTGPNDEGLSRGHIFNAVEGSLKRLGTDYIDLYQTHWYDENIPIEETMSALDDLVRQGKVRYLGCSNYPAWRLTEALWASRLHGLSRYHSLQPHYNLVHREEFERELADVCQAYGLGVISYSPLAGGFLTGKYRPNQQNVESSRATRAGRYANPRNYALLNLMEGIGKDLGDCSVSQVALAWILANPLISSAIIGPRTLSQLEDNLEAVGVVISPEQKQSIDKASAWAE